MVSKVSGKDIMEPQKFNLTIHEQNLLTKIYICQTSSKTSECFLSTERLATSINKSPRQTQTILKKLITINLIEVVGQRGRNRSYKLSKLSLANPYLKISKKTLEKSIRNKVFRLKNSVKNKQDLASKTSTFSAETIELKRYIKEKKLSSKKEKISDDVVSIETSKTKSYKRSSEDLKKFEKHENINFVFSTLKDKKLLEEKCCEYGLDLESLIDHFLDKIPSRGYYVGNISKYIKQAIENKLLTISRKKETAAVQSYNSKKLDFDPDLIDFANEMGKKLVVKYPETSYKIKNNFDYYALKLNYKNNNYEIPLTTNKDFIFTDIKYFINNYIH